MAKNDPLQHCYLTAHGLWASNTPWNGETAQIGIRFSAALTASAPGFGETFTQPLGSNVTERFATVAGTNGTLTQAWEAELGSDGLGIPYDGAQQIDSCEDMYTYLSAIQQYTSSGFSWTEIKIAPITADGKYGGAASIYTLTTPLNGGGSSTATEPPETAIAVSIMAPVIGRRGRGRMYIPAVGGGVMGSYGVVTPAAVAVYGTATKQLIDDLQQLPGAPQTYFPLVMVTSAGRADAIRPSEVRVGNHFDVQSRRQDQSPEAYASTPL